MDAEYKVLTLPRRADQILFAPVGFVLAALGISFALNVWLGGDGHPVFVAVAVSVAFALTGAGLLMLWGAVLRIRLFPEGLAVMAGHTGVFMLPAEQIRLICELYVFNGKRYTRMIGLSTAPVEEWAARRERALRKNPFSKHNVDLRKRKGNWQEQFAQEELQQCAKRYPVQSLRRGILWLTWSEDLRDLLVQTYPRTERVVWVRPGSALCGKWKDPDATDFCRGWVRQDTMDAMARIYLGIGAWAMWLYVVAPKAGAMILLMILFLAAIFGGLFMLMGGERDRIRVEDSKIAVYRNGRVHQWYPTDGVKTVFRIPINGNSGVLNMFGPEDSVLLVTDQTVEAVAAESRVAAAKRRDGVQQLALWDQLPQSQRYAAADLLTRKAATGFGPYAKDMIFGYSAGREETLRRYLPQAQWIDLRCEDM